MCLNDVEIALLTPMRTYGFVFTYSGGKQCNLKGVLSYFRVKEYDIARAVMQLDVLGLNEHVVVLYTGEFTKEQKKKAKERCTIRVDKVVRAVEWLARNNRLWSNVNVNDIRTQLRKIGPVVIDESKNVDGSTDGVNSNIEITETFVAYFPDGTMKTVSGGQASIDKFKTLVERSKFCMDQLEFQCVLQNEAADDFKDDNFVRACLLQFPYGFGGINERRLNKDGSSTNSVNLTEYVRHLSYISQPHFHRPLFVLVLYSIYQRQIMLRTSSLNVRSDVDYNDLATALSADDVDEAVAFRRAQQAQRRNGYAGQNIPGGTFLSNKFLNSIDAVTKALPHSNAAAGRARTEGECLCHYFGFPSIFLSFAPDDESSFLLQIFAGVTIDDDTPVDCLTDEQLAARAKDRRELRIKNPGLCALYFEIMLEIVLEDIVGIDIRNKKVLKEGFFGLVEAAMVTVEEQGRLSLHTHILLWISALKEMLRQAQDTSKRESKKKRLKAKSDIADKLAFISTTNLVGNSSQTVLRRVFRHECCASCKIIPRCVDNQQLRNLRHRVGCAATNYVFAVCESCRRTWTHEEIVKLFLQKSVQIPSFGSYPDTCKRLNALCVQYQKPPSNGADAAVVNAAYNTHFSFHTKTCFPCIDNSKGKTSSQKRKRKHDECRMRLPDLKRVRACVNDTGEKPWYKWDGTNEKKTMLEINPRRGQFDEFQNVSCPVISESKMTCNSNIQIIAPGPVVVYCTKYSSKSTQKDETDNYERVAKATREMLSDERKHPDDRKEAIRRILRASFAHNKANVVGPSMASWLTRMGSRFMISKSFAWCPLRDLDTLLKRSTLHLTLKTIHGVSFFENAALHYLCRPSELEGTDAAKFYTEYEVRYISQKKKKRDDDEDDSEVIAFENTEYFSHPSFKEKTGHMAQGVRRREESLVLKLHQWYFPDSAKFNGSLLDERTVITPVIEQYSRLVLMLFYPFRCEDDLLLDGSHTKRLRHCVKHNLVRQFAFEYLQNVQDSRSNALRFAAVEDELSRKTVPFQVVDDGLIHSDSDDDSNASDDEQLQPDFLDQLIDDMLLSTGTLGDDDTLPSKLDFTPVMNKGSKQCGYDCVADISTSTAAPATANSQFIRSQNQTSTSTDQQEQTDDVREQHFQARQTKSRKEIVETTFKFTNLRKRSFPTFSNSDEPVNVKEANGTASSIIDWARKAKLDSNQMRTFEILTSSFVLTFYDDALNNDVTRTRDSRFRANYKKLHRLSGRSKKNENLVGFVHGPGGAGKSTIVDLVILYCKEYCENLNVPFTSQTIVVTALTGVAATILMGETTHRAVYLNQRREISAEQVDNWKETRLLIVDEVSFAAPSLFEKLDENLRTLTGKLMERYGGINIVFSGDLQQLKPVNESSVCDTDCPQFEEWVNCYIELEGKHRFKDDPEWGELLFRFRNGVPTIQDIRRINERICLSADDLPPNIRYATFRNRDRDAINTAVFMKYCSARKNGDNGRVLSAVVILSDNLEVKNSGGAYVAVKKRQNFWQNCGEDEVRCKDRSNGRVDPALKLFYSCPVMLTANDDVKRGRANGTRARVEHVVLKHGETHFYIDLDGCIVPAVFASQVERVQLKHENTSIQPQVFDVKPRKYSVYAYVSQPGTQSKEKSDKDRVEMRINQLPITSNIATTGHKLQGSGVDSLFVHAWNYKDNWPYVVLSRVRTILGLFLREPLDFDLRKYAMSPILKRKIERFRKHKMRPIPTKEEYTWMESDTVSSVGEPVSSNP
jgi:hypothetical protein